MKVTIAVGHNGPEVHTEGCGDVARGLRSGKYQAAHRFEVDTLEGAAIEFWADFIGEGSMTERDAVLDTRFLPCTRKATA